MQLALYRAERPETFEEIIGQKHIVRILQNQLKNGTVSQAYLFTGTHGTGKTSTARILAKALNCINSDGTTEDTLPCGKCEACEAIREGRYPDVIELDAASNNGVDDLRAIIDLVNYPPAIGKYKVYIIDEVHMLTPQAENAFLKTLEEPPEYAIFILATTDPQKVRPTIKSRCMQLNFRRVTEDELIDGMSRICDRKHFAADREALGIIAARADGSVRDALSILEQCMAASRDGVTLDEEDVLEAVGSAGQSFNLELTESVAQGDLGKAFGLIDAVCREGKNPKQLIKDWLWHYRDIMILKYVDKPERIINASEENIARVKAQSKILSMNEVERAIKLLSEYVNLARYSDRPRILLEAAAVRLARGDKAKETAEGGPTTSTERGNAKREAMSLAEKTSKVAPENTDKVAPENTDKVAQENTGKVAQAEPVPAEVPSEPETAEIVSEEPARAAAPSEPELGDEAERMWQRIVEEISKNERSFGTIIGKNSYGQSFQGDELVVVVKPNKLALAQDSADDISRVIKNLYGARCFVALRPGNVDRSMCSAELDQPTETIIDDDKEWDEVATDLGEFLGVEVDIVDK